MNTEHAIIYLRNVLSKKISQRDDLITEIDAINTALKQLDGILNTESSDAVELQKARELIVNLEQKLLDISKSKI